MNKSDELPCCKSDRGSEYCIHPDIVVGKDIAKRRRGDQRSKLPRFMIIQFFSQAKYGIGTKNGEKKRGEAVGKGGDAKNMIAQCRCPKKKMGFIYIIAAMVIKGYVITGQIHSKGNGCMVS